MKNKLSILTLIFSLSVLLLSLNNSIIAQTINEKQAKQDTIIEKYLKKGAYQYHYLLHGWRDWIDVGLEEDSTIAYLWEMKALPYWKTQKYELALECYKKAIQYNRARNLGRQGYMRCIFEKNYKEAIKDMEMAEKEFGYGYQNDHSYQFYIALSHLQLGNFEKAEQILQEDFKKTTKARGENWIHYLDLFYMGIVQYELRDYDKAITYFDKAIAEYSHFSDAKYYKGLCFFLKGKRGEAKELILEAKADFAKGYSINEDDSFYEQYPYKVNWFMCKWTIPDYKE
jgi:tetratricopeptide (TPR) repeat protein